MADRKVYTTPQVVDYGSIDLTLGSTGSGDDDDHNMMRMMGMGMTMFGSTFHDD